MTEINEYIIKFFYIVEKMEVADLFSEAATLSKTEFRLIREIVTETERGNRIISSELSRRLGVTRSAVSQIVTRLEARDIVKRTAAPDDRKIAYIELSEHALSVFEEQCRQANAVMEEVLAKIGKEKMNMLIDGYEEFARELAVARTKAVGKSLKKKSI